MTLLALFYKFPPIAQRGLYFLGRIRRFISEVGGFQHLQADFYIVPLTNIFSSDGCSSIIVLLPFPRVHRIHEQSRIITFFSHRKNGLHAYLYGSWGILKNISHLDFFAHDFLVPITAEVFVD